MRPRTGAVSLAELVLVAALFAAMLAGLARFAADQGRLAAVQRDRTRMEEAARTAAVVLGAELRFMAPEDLAATGPESLRVRAIRGGGPVCAHEGATVWVRYRGVRLPEPAKDSILLFGPDGERAAAILATSTSPRCAGSRRIDVGSSPYDVAHYALIYEPGEYGLSGGALRYRRGAGGRQPLTEAILAGSRFHIGGGAVRIHLAADPDSLPWLRDAETRIRVTPRNLLDPP